MKTAIKIQEKKTLTFIIRKIKEKREKSDSRACKLGNPILLLDLKNEENNGK